MAATNGSKNQTIVRPLQYRDIDAIASLCQQPTITDPTVQERIEQLLKQMTRWHAPFQFLNIIPTPNLTDRSILVAAGTWCDWRIAIQPYPQHLACRMGINRLSSRHPRASNGEKRHWFAVITVLFRAYR
jgi:hypothetical protein